PVNPEASEGVAQVVRSGKAELVSELTPAMFEQPYIPAEYREALRALGLASYMCAPLVARGRVLGALAFLSATPGRRFGRADLRAAEDLAARAGLALDNARLFAAEQKSRRRAEHLQAIAAALSGASSGEEVARALVEHAFAATGALTGAVWTLTPDGASLAL